MSCPYRLQFSTKESCGRIGRFFENHCKIHHNYCLRHDDTYRRRYQATLPPAEVPLLPATMPPLVVSEEDMDSHFPELIARWIEVYDKERLHGFDPVIAYVRLRYLPSTPWTNSLLIATHTFVRYGVAALDCIKAALAPFPPVSMTQILSLFPYKGDPYRADVRKRIDTRLIDARHFKEEKARARYMDTKDLHEMREASREWMEAATTWFRTGTPQLKDIDAWNAELVWSRQQMAKGDVDAWRAKIEQILKIAKIIALQAVRQAERPVPFPSLPYRHMTIEDALASVEKFPL